MLIQLLILAAWAPFAAAGYVLGGAAMLVLLLHAGIRPRDLVRGLR